MQLKDKEILRFQGLEVEYGMARQIMQCGKILGLSSFYRDPGQQCFAF